MAPHLLTVLILLLLHTTILLSIIKIELSLVKHRKYQGMSLISQILVMSSNKCNILTNNSTRMVPHLPPMCLVSNNITLVVRATPPSNLFNQQQHYHGGGRATPPSNLFSQQHYSSGGRATPPSNLFAQRQQQQQPSPNQYRREGNATPPMSSSYTTSPGRSSPYMASPSPGRATPPSNLFMQQRRGAPPSFQSFQ